MASPLGGTATGATDPGATTSTQPTATETTPTPSAAEAPDGNIVADAAAVPAAEAFDSAKLTLPEGYDLGENGEAFGEVMKEFGVSQAGAQRLIDMAHKAIEKAITEPREAWNKQQLDWQETIKKDAELGGANFDNVKQTIARVLDNSELTDPGFREAVGFTGVGNHPAFVRTIFRWAKALSEGASVTGDPTSRTANGHLTNTPASGGLYGPDGPHTGGPNIRS